MSPRPVGNSWILLHDQITNPERKKKNDLRYHGFLVVRDLSSHVIKVVALIFVISYCYFYSVNREDFALDSSSEFI